MVHFVELNDWLVIVMANLISLYYVLPIRDYQ